MTIYIDNDNKPMGYGFSIFIGMDGDYPIAHVITHNYNTVRFCDDTDVYEMAGSAWNMQVVSYDDRHSKSKTTIASQLLF